METVGSPPFRVHGNIFIILVCTGNKSSLSTSRLTLRHVADMDGRQLLSSPGVVWLRLAEQCRNQSLLFCMCKSRVTLIST